VSQVPYIPPPADDLGSPSEGARAPVIEPGAVASPPELSVIPGELNARRPGAVWRARPADEPVAAPPRKADLREPYAWVLPRRLQFFLELLATAVAGLVAWEVLIQWRWLDPGLPDESLASHGALLGSVGLLMFAGLAWNGGFSTSRRISGVDDGLLLVKHLVLAVALALLIAFVTAGFGTGFTAYSPRVVLAYVALILALTAAGGAAAYTWQRRMFRRGEGVRHVVVAGDGAAAAEFERFLQKRRWLGVRCAGVVPVLEGATESQRLGGLVMTAPVLGGIDDLPRAVRQTGAGEVVIALDEDERAAFPRLATLLADAGIRFRVLPALFEVGYVYARSAGLNGLPTVALRVEAVDRARLAGKRLMDTFIAAGTLVVLSPLLLLVAALVKLTSPGPVFFRQERVGRDGRHFFMIKFRSMYAGAEARLKDLMGLNEGETVLFKIKNDPRVTPVGRFIRRWSIDELPQFFNVLRGEMSVVGPRPPLPREVSLYETAQLARLRGKPGITGLWQVSGRSDLTFAQMVELDRHYLEHWSLGLDVSIMLRTALAIVRRRGAY